MATYFAEGGPDDSFDAPRLRAALEGVLQRLGRRTRVLAAPPDYTRLHSQSGPVMNELASLLGDRLTDVLPTLGTHAAMTARELSDMYPRVPADRFRVHRWRSDVVRLGEVPARFVREQTGGVWDRPWPAETNQLIARGRHDLIVSIGQVVPHEVIGMAGYNKNLFVGAGGTRGIHESHFLSAAFGMERTMGRADTPLRRILNYASDHFLSQLPLVYVLTVVAGGRLCGLFIGDCHDCFYRAAALARRVNFTLLPEQPRKVVAWMDGREFKSTWLANKAIYRTRMAIADGGELVVIAPGVQTFGEDAVIDRLIRRHGYRTTPEVMAAVRADPELRENLSAAAHLIHGSPEGRFRVTYCPGRLSAAEVESVGYTYADCDQATHRYAPGRLAAGWNQVGGERLYFIPNPALGLWAHRSRLTE